MDFTMKLWRNIEAQIHGITLQKFLTDWELQLSLKEKYFAFMEVSLLKSELSTRWEQFTDLKKFQKKGHLLI